MKINSLYKINSPVFRLASIKKAILLLGFLILPFLGLSQSTVVVTAIDTIATESAAGNDIGIFQIDLGSVNNTGAGITVNYIFGGTATSGADYVNLGGSVTIANGSRTRQLKVEPIDDAIFEGNESVQIRLTGTNIATFSVANNASSTVSITLVDNEGCSAGPNKPELRSGIQTRFCDGVEVDLSSFVTSTTPAGTTLEWSKSSSPDPTKPDEFLTSSIITTGGRYYGFYYGSFENKPCISPIANVPELTFDVAPSVGQTNTNNQRCNVLGSGSNALDLDNAISNETTGGVWNLIVAPQGETTTISATNAVNYLNQPTGTYTYTYTPNYAGSPGCTNIESIEVTIYVTACKPCEAGSSPPKLVEGIETTFCVEAGARFEQDLLKYSNEAGPNGTKLIWSRDKDYTRIDARLDETIVSNEGTYYAYFYDEANDCASPVLAVSIILNEQPSIIEVSQNALCSEGIMTLNATSTDGSTINWYETKSSTKPLQANSSSYTTPNLTATTVYYVESTLGNCVSERVEVVAAINQEPVVQSIGAPINACNIKNSNYPTVIDLNTGLTQSVTGTWAITSDPSNSVAITNGHNVNFENIPQGTYRFTFTTNSAVAPCANKKAVVTIIVRACIIDTDSDGLSDDDEIIIGTNPNKNDTDNDGILDAVEVGDDIANPFDEDLDGIIDALESDIVDTDLDGVVDQLDPANSNPCIPDNTVGMCDTDGDGISDGVEIANGSDHLDPCDPNLTTDCAPAPIDLEITKTVDILSPEVYDVIEFTITLSNLSADRVIAITVNELISAEHGFAYISHVTTAGIYNVTTGKWEIQEIQGNDVNTLKIKAKVLLDGDYINTAEITTNYPTDSDLTNNKASINVEVKKRSNTECGFLFNQFSPNGDGTNDFLIINCILEYPNNTLEIFDRYGNQVYKVKYYDNTWTGTGKNGDLPKGTYYYVLNLGDGSPIKKDWIQIIR